ncbi:transposase [Neisseria shayeganii 871]|uniref:Transposase n=1 Tax=Neisseria shayeganii 871 TaxID=1032488 RepID=G4CLM6_9NEIS|nr:transposase [Neisseria shayeganii 871]
MRDNGGRPAYPLLSMFKAVLLGQWHSLSDPELEYSLITRMDFQLFCASTTSAFPTTAPFAVSATGWLKTTP